MDLTPWVGGLAAAGDLVPLDQLGVSSKGLDPGSSGRGASTERIGMVSSEQLLGLGFDNKKPLKAAGVTPPTDVGTGHHAARPLTTTRQPGMWPRGSARTTPRHATCSSCPSSGLPGGDLSMSTMPVGSRRSRSTLSSPGRQHLRWWTTSRTTSPSSSRRRARDDS